MPAGKPSQPASGQQSRGWLNREYRRLGIGLCFLTFMAGGLCCSLIAGLFLLLPVSAARRKRFSLGLVHHSLRFFLRFMMALRLMARFEMNGREHLDTADKPTLFIANHPTLIDIVAIMATIPKCNCIIKSSLFNNPFYGFFIRRAGLVPNDCGPDLLDRVGTELAEGTSLVVFPEGTRSPEGGLHPFKRGAAQIAVRHGVTIVPIRVQCEPSTLRKGQPWYDITDRPVDFRLDIAPPFDIPDHVKRQPEVPLKVRALTRALENYYREWLAIPGKIARPSTARDGANSDEAFPPK